PKPDTQFMPVEDIRAGMTGYGITVFQGTKPERFEVTVLGVLQGVPNPKQCSVIAKLSGAAVERTSVFAGMSGSPVYIDNKLVGAVAFTYPFSKEPIAGITPIKFMIENFDRGPEHPAQAPQRVSFSTLIADNGAKASAPDQATAGSSRTEPVSQMGSGGLVPIATPVSISGVPQQAIDFFSSELKKFGIQAIAGAGGASALTPMVAATDDTLAPGTSVSVQLVRGDFTLDAAGTVTYREGNKIYAFGHPFLSSGVTSWPMAESPVITVVPNVNNSFKLDAGGSLVGSICQDRSTGVYGELGQKPKMIPVHVVVHTSRNKTETYNFEMISDPALTPLLMKLMTFSAVTATERSIGSQTISLNGRISIAGQPDLVLDNTFSTANGAVFQAVAAVEKPLAVLLGSGFDPIDITGINVDVTSNDARASGTLSRLWVDKTEVHRGDTIEVQAFARNDNGAEFVQRIPVKIPVDAPVGEVAVLVGDGNSINVADLRAQAGSDFTPKDLGQLVRRMNKLKHNNRLYVKVLRPGGGAVVNDEEMPTLPPSVLATLNSQRTSGGYSPLLVATLTESELPPSVFVITGQQSIMINIVK
ncbi:MAG TPA: hypothetical protein VLZ81_04165, partial [Blastocatellia bacterium]|nr:hypothetical protein [Blastocatellia bacterium]